MTFGQSNPYYVGVLIAWNRTWSTSQYDPCDICTSSKNKVLFGWGVFKCSSQIYFLYYRSCYRWLHERDCVVLREVCDITSFKSLYLKWHEASWSFMLDILLDICLHSRFCMVLCLFGMVLLLDICIFMKLHAWYM